jgi:hypothetical protein
VEGDVPVDTETFLVTDFINLKIKPTQSFECAHRDRLCVHMFIRMSTHMYISIYVCTMFLKKRAFIFLNYMKPMHTISIMISSHVSFLC